MRDSPICKACINRNEIKKKGSELLGKIEELPPSDLQTNISIMAIEYIDFVNNSNGNKFNCQNCRCEYNDIGVINMDKTKNRQTEIMELGLAIQTLGTMLDNAKKEKDRLIKLREKYMCWSDEEFEQKRI